MQIRRFWGRIRSILFPPTCVSCENVLLNAEVSLCPGCQYHLPINNFHLYLENDAYKRLKGKVAIQSAVAYFSFSRSSLVQTMIHKIKYRGAYDICDYFGYRFGRQLSMCSYYQSVDVVVPFPLLRKLKSAGKLNQNECLARSIAAGLTRPVNSVDFVCTTVEGSRHAGTTFQCLQPESFTGKHILLINDLISEDGELIRAIQTLIQQSQCRVSVATLAID